MPLLTRLFMAKRLLKALSSLASFPLTHATLSFAAIKFTESNIFWHILNQLIAEPAFDPVRCPFGVRFIHLKFLPHIKH